LALHAPASQANDPHVVVKIEHLPAPSHCWLDAVPDALHTAGPHAVPEAA
jgi:hypothetical protein